jgi:COMM domain containing 7
MDWRFGVTASNSELASVGTTFLQLRLVLNRGNKIERVTMGTNSRSSVVCARCG